MTSFKSFSEYTNVWLVGKKNKTYLKIALRNSKELPVCFNPVKDTWID